MTPRVAFLVLPELLAAPGARANSEVTPTSMQTPEMELAEPQFSRTQLSARHSNLPKPRSKKAERG